MFASPATESPEIVPTASGRKSPISRVSAANATKSPLDVIEAKKSGPRPGRGVDTLTAIAMMTGTAARMPIPAWLRRRPKISPSSERRKRVEMRRGARSPGALVASSPERRVLSPVTSAADIEALPGEGHEQVFQAGPFDRKTCHGHTVVHEGYDHLLCGHFAQSTCSPARFGYHLGQPERPQHSRGILGAVGLDPGPGLAHGSHLGDRPLGEQHAHVHHADVGAHLLNLGQEMAGDQHRGCLLYTSDA